jgi:hypothetical protein
MELAEKIHQSLSAKADSHDLLNIINEIKDKNTLAYINEFFMERYNITLNELVADIFGVADFYAISSTLTYIREPNKKNHRVMDNFYREIGYRA